MKILKAVMRYLLAAFFIFAGVNHFLNPDFYINIMPGYMPAHGFLVGLSGVTEIIAGVMLAIPATSRLGAWFIIAHLVIFFAVHIDMIVVWEEKFREQDIPLGALYGRIVFQFIFIAWAFWFTRPIPGSEPPEVEPDKGVMTG